MPPLFSGSRVSYCVFVPWYRVVAFSGVAFSGVAFGAASSLRLSDSAFTRSYSASLRLVLVSSASS